MESRVSYQLINLVESLYMPKIEAARFKSGMKGGKIEGTVSPTVYGVQDTLTRNIYRLADTPRGRQLYEDFFFRKPRPEAAEIKAARQSIDDETVWDALGLEEFRKGLQQHVGNIPAQEKSDFMEWWLRYLMSLRVRRYTADATRDMVASGFGLASNDPAYRALDYMVTRPGGRKMKQAVLGHGSIAETRAVEYLRRMGLDEFMLQSKGIVPYDMQTMWTQARDGVGMMGNIASEYRRMRDVGRMDPRSLKAGGLYSQLQAMTRELMTYGSVLLGGPKASYIAANLLSAPEMMMMTTGAAKGAAGAARIFTAPRFTAGLIRRNALGYSPPPSADEVLRTFVDGRGNVWTEDEMVGRDEPIRRRPNLRQEREWREPSARNSPRQTGDRQWYNEDPWAVAVGASCH